MTILRPRLPVLTLLFTVVLLLQPGPTPTATVTTVGAATPEAAVQTLLSSFTTPGATGGSCNALSGRFQGCPITARLLARLQSATENGNILSRSQNPPQSVSISLLDNDGQTAHVNTVWQFGVSAYTITFTAIKTPSGWQVDDSYCANLRNTTIFTPPTGPCPADIVQRTTAPSSTSTVTTPASTTLAPNPTSLPGVPTTGNPGKFDPIVVLVMLLAALSALSGLIISFRARSSRAT
jgi:hypothetical protein